MTPDDRRTRWLPDWCSDPSPLPYPEASPHSARTQASVEAEIDAWAAGLEPDRVAESMAHHLLRDLSSLPPLSWRVQAYLRRIERDRAQDEPRG